MNSCDMFNGERYDSSQRKRMWRPHPPFQIHNNRVGVHRNLEDYYVFQKQTPELVQNHQSDEYRASIKKSNTLQDIAQDQDNASLSAASQKLSHTSPGFKLSYEHLQSACFFPKAISLTKNSTNPTCRIHDSKNKNINDEVATNTNTVSSGSGSERNSLNSSSNKATNAINDGGPYGTAPGTTSKIFLSPADPSAKPYYSEGLVGLGCKNLASLDFFSRVSHFPPVFISPPLCFPPFQPFAAPIFVANGQTGIKSGQDSCGNEYCHTSNLSLKENNSTPNMGSNNTHQKNSSRKYSCNSSHESSQMLQSQRKSLPVEKGSANVYKTTYNKFNGPCTNTSTSNKLQGSAAQAQNENTEILSVSVKLSMNRTEIFKVKRFDNLYHNVKMFCESHSIAEHMIRPLCETISHALNGIFAIFNLQVEKAEEEYLKSLLNNTQHKEKDTLISSVHDNINKLKGNIYHGEEMLSISSLTTVDYNDDDCHSCASFESRGENNDDINKLNKTF